MEGSEMGSMEERLAWRRQIAEGYGCKTHLQIWGAPDGGWYEFLTPESEELLSVEEMAAAIGPMEGRPKRTIAWLRRDGPVDSLTATEQTQASNVMEAFARRALAALDDRQGVDCTCILSIGEVCLDWLVAVPAGYQVAPGALKRLKLVSAGTSYPWQPTGMRLYIEPRPAGEFGHRAFAGIRMLPDGSVLSHEVMERDAHARSVERIKVDLVRQTKRDSIASLAAYESRRTTGPSVDYASIGKIPFADDIVGFVERFFPYKLDDWQKDLLLKLYSDRKQKAAILLERPRILGEISERFTKGAAGLRDVLDKFAAEADAAPALRDAQLHGKGIQRVRPDGSIGPVSIDSTIKWTGHAGSGDPQAAMNGDARPIGPADLQAAINARRPAVITAMPAEQAHMVMISNWAQFAAWDFTSEDGCCERLTQRMDAESDEGRGVFPIMVEAGVATLRYGCADPLKVSLSVADIHCTECGWEGDVGDLPYSNPQNAESHVCPGCNAHAGPDGCMAEGPQPATPAPGLDAAIAASSAIDKAAPAKDLRVQTPEEREAERLRLADYFSKNGVL
jgi:hypothetical protein